MSRNATRVAGLVLLFSGTVIAFAQSPVVFATGVDSTGNVTAPERSVDIHFTVRKPGSNAEGPAYIYRRAFNDNQTYSPWIKNSPNSAWISAIQVQTIEIAGGYFAKADGPSGEYFYSLTFDMTGFDPATLTFAGRWAADDDGMFMYLNGFQIFNVGTRKGPKLGNSGFDHWTPFWLCQPGMPCGPSNDVVDGDGTFTTANVLPGLNKLTFEVHNLAGPTGLRVELTASANLLAKTKNTETHGTQSKVGNTPSVP
jgi:hypothetical protein